MSDQSRWSLMIHGGAGSMERETVPAERERQARESLSRILEAGAALLRDGGRALDAVELTVRLLEDDPLFNAGKGSVTTADGRFELDAAIMDGRDRRAGAVAGVTRSRNPVSLARAVMEHDTHVLLAGPGADAFSRQACLDQVEPDYFAREPEAAAPPMPDKLGTVGAVALDRDGNLAAATSTGGIIGKQPGRVGDTPIIGAGTYADNRCAAVSATGSGEHYIRAAVAHEICARMRLAGDDALAAAEAVQQESLALGGAGGVIVVSRTGEAIWAFNTTGMFRGRASSNGDQEVAIFSEAEEAAG